MRLEYVCILKKHVHHTRCTCGQCVAMDISANSFCCRECPQLDAIRQEEEGVECCTENSGVRVVATNPYVLRAAYNANRRRYGQRRGRARDRPWTGNEYANILLMIYLDSYIHNIFFRKQRHIAYGNVVVLAWGHLGRGNRVPLPACVMKIIREAFPSESYTGYKHHRDESQ